MKRNHIAVELFLFALLVSFGVLGRWLQPDWNVTPLCGVALFAGYYFSRRGLAYTVPLATLIVSNLILPQYHSIGIFATVYACSTIPVYLGTKLRENESYLKLATFGLLPAVLFFIATNFAVWMFNDLYPHSWQGLAACYTNALPFFRSMILGDLFYVSAIFGTYKLATQHLATQHAVQRNPAYAVSSRSKP